MTPNSTLAHVRPLQPRVAYFGRDFLEAPQGLDLPIELRHTIHRIEHHDLGAETLPAMRGGGPKLRVGFVNAQPAFEPELGRIASERLQMLAQSASFGSAASGDRIGIQPSPMRAARLTTASDDPPNQIGIGRWIGTRQHVDVDQVWNRPLKVTRSSDHRRRITSICSACRAPRVFHSVPSASYSTWFQPTPTPSRKPAAAQDIDLGRLLGDDAGLALRQDEHAAAQLDGLGDGRNEGHRRESLMEGIVLAVGRLPIAARCGAEDVIGHLDAVEAEALRGLRPIADLRGSLPMSRVGKRALSR